LKTIDDIAQEHFGKEIILAGNGPGLVIMPSAGDFFARYMQNVRDRENGVGRDINGYNPPLTKVTRLADNSKPLWSINGGHSYHPGSNLGWMMDNHLSHSAASHPQPEFYDGLIKDSKIPIITSKAYPAYPAMVEFPLKEVVKKFKSKRFDETVDYMLAFSGYCGVKKVTVIGCDYQLFDRFPGERAGTEYWIGRLEGLGIEIDTSPSQNLMKPSPGRGAFFHPTFYGYSFDDPTANDPEVLEIVESIHY